MTNFVPIAVLDTWSLSASLRARINLFRECRLPVIGDGIPPELDIERWAALRNVLSRVMRLPQAKGFEIERAAFELLGPGGAVDWHKRDTGTKQTLHLPIVTNPGAIMFCGVESIHMPTGVLYWWLNTETLCSEINLSEFNRIHLVIVARQKGQEDD